MYDNVIISKSQKVKDRVDIVRNSFAETARSDRDSSERNSAYVIVKKLSNPSHEIFVGIALKSIDENIRFDAVSLINPEKFDWVLARSLQEDPCTEVKLMAAERLDFSKFPTVAVDSVTSNMATEVRVNILDLIDSDVFNLVLDNVNAEEEVEKEFLKALFSKLDLKKDKHLRFLTQIIGSKTAKLSLVLDVLRSLEYNNDSKFVIYKAAHHANSHVRREVIKMLPSADTNVLSMLCMDDDLFVALDAVEKIDVKSAYLTSLAMIAHNNEARPYEAVVLKAAERLGDAKLLTSEIIFRMARSAKYGSQKMFAVRYLDPRKKSHRNILWEMILDDKSSHVLRLEALKQFKRVNEKIRQNEFGYVKNIKDIYQQLNRKNIRGYQAVDEIRILVLQLMTAKR